MENKKIKKILNVLCYVLLVITFVLCVYMYTDASHDIFKIFTDSLCLATVVAGFLYAINKYKKNAAHFYKAFMFLACLETVAVVIYVMLVSSERGYSSSVPQVLETILGVSYFMLTFAKDLGEKTSKGIAYSVLVVAFINSLRLIILNSTDIMLIASALIGIFTPGVVVIFVLEKYYDKAERGTK